MNQKNKDLPAYPIKFNDQFGQLVILGGMTKLEVVALKILGDIYLNDDVSKDNDTDERRLKYIKEAYNMAELFCSYIEDKLQQESKIIS